MSDEEVVEGPLAPVEPGTDAEKIYQWQPPDHRTMRTAKRIAQIEAWIASQHTIVDEEEIIRYSMQHFNLTRENAKHYLARVVEDFKRRGLPVFKS